MREIRAKQRAALAGIVMDLGADDGGAFAKAGLFAPESMGARRASWSNGPVSRLSFELEPEDTPYLVSFLAEPYGGLAPVPAKLALNGRRVWDGELRSGWHGYALLLDVGSVRAGNNELSLTYSKTARPADIDVASSDERDLCASLDQVRVEPVSDHVRLSFSPRNAATRGSLGDGWAIDGADLAPGIWTLGPSAAVRLHVLQPAPRPAELEISAHSLAGVSSQAVQITWNEHALGKIVFGPKRATVRLRVPAESLRDTNELVLAPENPTSPQALDPASGDTRLLGLRVLKIELFPALEAG